MGVQIPTNLQWYESVESAAHRAQLENIHMAAGSGSDDPRLVNAVQSTTIRYIVALTQAEYDALGGEAPATLYVITDGA